MAKETGQPQAKLGGMTAEMWLIVTEIFTASGSMTTVDVRIKIERAIGRPWICPPSPKKPTPLCLGKSLLELWYRLIRFPVFCPYVTA